MEQNAAQSDKGIGMLVLFSLLAVGGAAAMLVVPGQVNKALGFALAIIAASLAVVATQVYS